MRKLLAFIFIAIIVYTCSRHAETKVDSTTQQSTSYPNSNSNYNSNPSGSNSNDNYHVDQNYKYESRTGASGDYEYNYDVNGSDADGNSISGNIDVNGKYGSGTIEDENGNEKDVDVEWVDHGVLEATDEDGNTYELETDD